MYEDLGLESPPEGMTRVLAFTLGTSLCWLGHVCQGQCPPQAATLQASVWFVEQAATTAGDDVNVLVAVRFGSNLTGGTSDAENGLIDRVNRCAQRDHIRVYERSAATWNNGLTVLCDADESRSPILAHLR